MSHKSRRPPPIECPLASLGHNSPSDHQPYHHPLSSSPLNPNVYQMSSRTSPLLNINPDGIIQYTSVHEIDDFNQTNDGSNSNCNNDGEYVNCGASYRHQMSCDYTNEDSVSISYQQEDEDSGSATNLRDIKRDRINKKNRINPIGYQIENVNTIDNCYNNQPPSETIGHSEQYFLENKMRTFFIEENAANYRNKFPYVKNDRYYLENCNINNRLENMSPNYLRRPSSPSETSESDRYLIERTPRESPAPLSMARSGYNFLLNHRRTPSDNSSTLMDALSARVGRFSPSYDQGYHTLVSPSPSGAGGSGSGGSGTQTGIHLRNRNRTETIFNKLPDELCMEIFSWVDSCDLCNVSKVCKRFDTLVWRPQLWKTITLKGEYINGDRALRSIFRRLSNRSRNVACPEVERVMLGDGCRLTDKGLELLSRRCPELTHLQVQLSFNITNGALFNLVTKCTNLQHLDVTGCSQITSIDFNYGLDPPRRLLLQFLDLTDCCALDDAGLQTTVQNCPQLVYLYLRRCTQISDIGLKFVPSFCTGLRELSVSDCGNITDFGLYELAKLGATLRYLSVAKCDQVSDAGLKVIARRCYKLRYLNARGCEAVSDDSITVLAHSCPRLRALDIGKCDVSDTGLHALAESCPNLKKISLKNCDMITDRGVQCIAYYCRGLQHLNIQDCQITLDGYRAVKKYCKRCVIEHTNPGFC